MTRVRPRIGGDPCLPARLGFNLLLPRRLDFAAYDAVVGFDLDGFRLRPGPDDRYAVALKGVAAEERRFERGRPRLALSLLAALEGRNARRASRVIVTSEHCRATAAAAYRLDRERVAVVPEGIDLPAWERAAAAFAAAGAAGPGAGSAPVVLSVARQYRRKDTRTLLEAFALLRERRPEARLRVAGGGPELPRRRARERPPDVRLRIAGGGPELPRLRARARELGLGESVTFLGPVADAEALRREYLCADVFCLPSLQEGFGIAFLEAMAAALPIVATRAAAIPEVVPDGEAGLLVPPRDPEALAAALVGLLDDGALRRHLGEAGRRRVERYDWPVVAGQLLKALGLA